MVIVDFLYPCLKKKASTIVGALFVNMEKLLNTATSNDTLENR